MDTKFIIICFLVLFINIPFGYWRANAKRFSMQWFLAIHIPVIFVIALRLGFHLGFAWYTYVFMVTAFILGQQFGSLIYKKLRQICINISSCMVMDLFRCKFSGT